jgi:hypothetical protein
MAERNRGIIIDHRTAFATEYYRAFYQRDAVTARFRGPPRSTTVTSAVDRKVSSCTRPLPSRTYRDESQSLLDVLLINRSWRSDNRVLGASQ